MEKKNQVLMTILGVFALAVVTVGVSYAFFTYSRTSTNAGTIQTGSLDFGFTETGSQNVTLANAMPIAESVATTTTATTNNVAVYDFSVAYNTTANVNVTYNIEIIKQAGATLDENLVKIALYENNINVKTSSLAAAIATPYSKTLATGATNNYSLRMWLDKDLAGFDATDGGNGTLTPEKDDNYATEDGKTATTVWSGKTLSIKVKVTALGTSN